jgi:ABC-type branched-subunit amino acid transport system ATPase component
VCRWRCRKGGITALLGANGAGKTTTLKAVSNLLKAERGQVTKGSITFKGERVDTMNPNDLVRRGCIQVMEGRHCFGHLNIEENLLTGAFTRKEDAPRSPATWRWSTIIFRASGSAGPAWRATHPAASSRCAPSDAR